MSMDCNDFSPREYKDGRTKQSFKDECDVNKILARAAQKGGLSHVQKYPEAVYGSFNQEVDLLTARNLIGRADEIFQALPSEVRREFQNDALEFVKYAGSLSPGELALKIPELAKPGNFFPNPAQRGGKGAGLATAPSEPPQAPASSSPAASPDPSSTDA